MMTRYEILQSRVDRYSANVKKHAHKECTDKGLDIDLLDYSNKAILNYRDNTWIAGEYSQVRKIELRLNQKQWKASNLVRRYCDRKFIELGVNYHSFMHEN